MNCYSIAGRATRRDYFQLTQIKEQLAVLLYIGIEYRRLLFYTYASIIYCTKTRRNSSFYRHVLNIIFMYICKNA
jgi:hypothetical protein